MNASQTYEEGWGGQVGREGIDGQSTDYIRDARPTTYLFKAARDKRLARRRGSGPSHTAGLWPWLRCRRHRAQVAHPPPCLLLRFGFVDWRMPASRPHHRVAAGCRDQGLPCLCRVCALGRV